MAVVVSIVVAHYPECDALLRSGTELADTDAIIAAIAGFGSSSTLVRAHCGVHPLSVYLIRSAGC